MGLPTHIRTIEMIGVLMRIFSFALVSWMGPASLFLFVWAFNTVDALVFSSPGTAFGEVFVTGERAAAKAQQATLASAFCQAMHSLWA